MSLLVGIHFSSGQISWTNAKSIKAKNALMDGGYVDDSIVRERLIEAKSIIGNAQIAETIFVMPAHCKTESRKILLTTASELGFGNCGIISNEAATCVNTVAKFKRHLREGEKMAVITKTKPMPGKRPGLLCHLWQKIGRQIVSFQKPIHASTDHQINQLKWNLRKYATFVWVDEKVNRKILKDIQHKILEHDHFHWSSSALLKAAMIHWKTKKSLSVQDFIEKDFTIMFNGIPVKEIQRPCLPFRTNIRLGGAKIQEISEVEIYEGSLNIATIDTKLSEANLQFSLDTNGIMKVNVGPALLPRPLQNNIMNAGQIQNFQFPESPELCFNQDFGCLQKLPGYSQFQGGYYYQNKPYRQVVGQVPLSTQLLAQVSGDVQKQLIGERLFPLVNRIASNDDVGKITGMMLKMDNSELLVILENEDMLKSKVNEAASVLHGSQKEFQQDANSVMIPNKIEVAQNDSKSYLKSSSSAPYCQPFYKTPFGSQEIKNANTNADFSEGTLKADVDCLINLQLAYLEEKSINVDAEEEEEIIQKFECLVCFVEYEKDDGYFSCTFWEKGDENNKHSICRECLQGHADAAITNAPIVPEADGIRCVEHGCKNVFVLGNVRNYLTIETAEALTKRMQQECILLASENGESDDTYKCEECGHWGWIDKDHPTFYCDCGAEKCTSCYRLYDEMHKGKTCEEAAELAAQSEKEKANLNVNEEISDCVIRKCPRCKAPIIKEDGCNKMTCTCGAFFCYLCKEKLPDEPEQAYEHFCRCPDHAYKSGTCNQCQKTCPLFEDSDAFDEKQIDNLLNNQESNVVMCDEAGRSKGFGLNTMYAPIQGRYFVSSGMPPSPFMNALQDQIRNPSPRWENVAGNQYANMPTYVQYANTPPYVLASQYQIVHRLRGPMRPQFQRGQRPARISMQGQPCLKAGPSGYYQLHNPANHQQMRHPPPIRHVVRQVPLSTHLLAQVSDEVQKQLIGERLFPLVNRIASNDDVGKITGMMLKMDNSELLVILENEDMLKSKVNEAASVLHGSQKESQRA